MADSRNEKHASRVYTLNDGTLLVKQTVLRNGRYVIDGHREAHVRPGDEARLQEVIRAAERGEL